MRISDWSSDVCSSDLRMRGVHQMFVEEDAALPERHSLFGIEEWVVEQDSREDRAQRQQPERHEHRPRAFVRVIAGGAVIGRAVPIVHRMLDMLARGPARLAVKGQEDEVGRAPCRESGCGYV